VASPTPEGRACLDRLPSIVDGVPLDSAATDGGPLVELPVRYDGADLADTASRLGMAPAELVRRHAAAEYRVAFCGFAPGFGYLTGLPPELHVPRLSTPRTRVPAGSVGLAGEFCGVYPRESPGGWRLLGRTDAVLWDAEREPAALLAPGTRVRFRPVDG
jgi:KipI family sensor histidine kinase inhibitor